MLATELIQQERQTVLRGQEEFKTYGFKESNKIAKLASEEIENFLLSLPETIKVVNVEENKMYQNADIDLLWYVRSRKTGKIVKKTIEIKGDTYYGTGNYFFETISNMEKNTPGCFIITESDFIFYYFIKQRELHIMPTEETRNWFLENKSCFSESITSTSISKKILYTSKGSIVPRREVFDKCNIMIVNIEPYI